MKWSFTLPNPNSPKYIVCNADEGEPGTIKDRYIMEGDPHRVLEGMAIAGYAIGAAYGYIYVRGEYYLSCTASTSHRSCRSKNLLGTTSRAAALATTSRCRPAAALIYACEETALIESIEGKRATPGSSRLSPASSGCGTNPPIVNNVESLATVPSIIVHGSEWYKAKGTEDSKGTKIFQVVGHVNKPGVVEANLGMTVRELIDKYGGGVRMATSINPARPAAPPSVSSRTSTWTLPWNTRPRPGRKAPAPGPCWSRTTPLAFGRGQVHPLLLPARVLRFCLPCRRGTRRCIVDLQGGRRKRHPADLDRMISLGRSMIDSSNCALGMSPYFFIKTTIERYADDYQAHLDGKCPLGVCKAEEHSH